MYPTIAPFKTYPNAKTLDPNNNSLKPLVSNKPGIFERTLESFFTFIGNVVSKAWKFLVKERTIATASAIVVGYLMWNLYANQIYLCKQIVIQNKMLDNTVYNLKRLWKSYRCRFELECCYDLPEWEKTYTVHDNL